MAICEMCGVEGRLFDVIVEGSVLSVCERCKGYGAAIDIEPKKEASLVSKRKVKRKIFVEEPVDFVIESAGRVVKDARERRELTQAQLAGMVGVKESVIHKVETSLMKPDLATAKKLERILDVKIIEDYKDPESKVQFNLDDENITIGDLIRFKKK